MFEKKGAVRIDADTLAHEAIEKGRGPSQKVIRFFGRGILRKDGSIDREKLARVVFKNRKKMDALNARIHPYVIRRIREEIRKRLRREKSVFIVVEVPLLHEEHLSGMVDKVLTVSCKVSVQGKRWLKQRKPLKELQERCRSQWPLSYKEKHSDFIIDNRGSILETRAQVSHIWNVINDQRKGKR